MPWKLHRRNFIFHQMMGKWSIWWLIKSFITSLESLDDLNIYRFPLAFVLGGNITMVVIHNWFAYKLTAIWPKNSFLEHPKYLFLPNNVHLSFKIQEEFLKKYYNHPILSILANHVLLQFEGCHVTCLCVKACG